MDCSCALLGGLEELRLLPWAVLGRLEELQTFPWALPRRLARPGPSSKPRGAAWKSPRIVLELFQAAWKSPGSSPGLFWAASWGFLPPPRILLGPSCAPGLPVTLGRSKSDRWKRHLVGPPGRLLELFMLLGAPPWDSWSTPFSWTWRARAGGQPLPVLSHQNPKWWRRSWKLPCGFFCGFFCGFVCGFFCGFFC